MQLAEISALVKTASNRQEFPEKEHNPLMLLSIKQRWKPWLWRAWAREVKNNRDGEGTCEGHCVWGLPWSRRERAEWKHLHEKFFLVGGITSLSEGRGWAPSILPLFSFYGAVPRLSPFPFNKRERKESQPCSSFWFCSQNRDMPVGGGSVVVQILLQTHLKKWSLLLSNVFLF